VKNSPINIGDALYGGRNKASGTYYSVKEGEKIQYVDVVCPPTFVIMASSLGPPECVLGCRLCSRLFG